MNARIAVMLDWGDDFFFFNDEKERIVWDEWSYKIPANQNHTNDNYTAHFRSCLRLLATIDYIRKLLNKPRIVNTGLADMAGYDGEE